MVPVAPAKSTVTTSPASGIVFIIQVLIDMLPARLGEVLEVLFRPAIAGIDDQQGRNIVQNQYRQLNLSALELCFQDTIFI